jgi:alcohol dehydrogenase
MKALVFTAAGKVEIQDVPPPEAVDGETIVHVTAVAICGSELHGVRNPGFRKPPLIMGHEIVGTTPGGGYVAVNPLVPCWECDLCGDGRENLCRNRALVGIHRPGGFAESVSVPNRNLRPLPIELEASRAALIEPLANAVHATNLANIRRSDRVGIIGAGPIGLVILQTAVMHSKDVSICDLSDHRLALASRLGARQVGRELVGEFDVIIDAVGAAPTHSASLSHLRPGGVAVWIGLLSADPGFDAQDLVRYEGRIIGSYCYTGAEFDTAVTLASELDLSWATTFDLSDGARIFTELMNGRDDIVKAVLQP